MVVLNRIYTRAGDDGSTRLATGEPLSKGDARVEAYGAVDETNAAVGMARLQAGELGDLDGLLERIQNELFDLGADLATPERETPLAWEPLRIIDSQVDALERDIDRLNAELEPLTSFVLPAGTPAATALHVARTVCRRAEREVVRLAAQPDERVSDAARRYLNRLSDLLFVASRWANGKGGAGDVLWRPGATR